MQIKFCNAEAAAIKFGGWLQISCGGGDLHVPSSCQSINFAVSYEYLLARKTYILHQLDERETTFHENFAGTVRLVMIWRRYSALQNWGTDQEKRKRISCPLIWHAFPLVLRLDRLSLPCTLFPANEFRKSSSRGFLFEIIGKLAIKNFLTLQPCEKTKDDCWDISFTRFHTLYRNYEIYRYVLITVKLTTNSLRIFILWMVLNYHDAT